MSAKKPTDRLGQTRGRERPLRSTRLAVAALLVLLMTGCAGVRSTPRPEVRQSLAPSGKLRVALLSGNAVHVLKDPASGELKGVGHDLGKELAARLQVPFEPVFYSAVGPMLDAAKAGAWDIAFVGVNAERGRFLDFTGHHMEIEFGYLVPAGSPISTIEDVDRPGVRIAAVERGSPEAYLARALKNATLVRAPRIAGSLELVKSGKADVVSGIKANLYEASAQLPGSRVIEGRHGGEEQAMAMPKGRAPEAAVYARKFIEDVKADGLVKAAIDRSGVRGVRVAPRMR